MESSKWIYGILGAGIIFSIISLKSTPKVSEEAEKATISEVEDETSYVGMENIFAPGEHIISIPIEGNIRINNFQYEYHPGYQPVGFAISAYEQNNKYAGGVIMYVNTEEVRTKVSGKNYEGEALFTEFGEPINYVEEDKVSRDIFLPGEHIISLPINKNIYDENVQLLSVDGYDIVGIATSSYGNLYSRFGGGAILLVNNTSVKCEPYEYIMGNIVYNKVGTPVDIKMLNLK